ncbi:hypothetical protein [Rhodoplanes sp. SY1]|uniref:hypothetical protein n=1 Tax=Rhodoplanes sp. SY1 TaxID=3166646 RepID=UPI0038B52EBB
MCPSNASTDRERESQRRIEWVLDHPRTSPWLKNALRSALLCDPIQIVNEVEMLRELLWFRSDAAVHKALQHPCDDVHGHAPGPEPRPVPDFR